MKPRIQELLRSADISGFEAPFPASIYCFGLLFHPAFSAAMSKCLLQTFLLDHQLANLLYCENVTVIIVKLRLP